MNDSNSVENPNRVEILTNLNNVMLHFSSDPLAINKPQPKLIVTTLLQDVMAETKRGLNTNPNR